MYKLVFVLFLVLAYFRRDIDYGFGNLLEVVMFGLLGLAILIDVFLWGRRIKSRVAKHASERIGG
jgi:hypothetical protein